MSYSVGQNKTVDSEVASESKFLIPLQQKVLSKNLLANIQVKYRRQIEIMLLADRSKSQTHICKNLSCSQEVARDWIAVAEAGLAYKWNERPIGRLKTVNHQYLERLKELVSLSPRGDSYAFSCLTAKLLKKHLAEEFEIAISDRHINRLLKQIRICNLQSNPLS